MNKGKMSRRQFVATTAMAGIGIALDWGRINALAARIQPKTDYPIVVIGAGLGGLCCGALLAKNGFPVTVIEQHDIPGGYATSFDRAGGKFTFDVSLHRISVSPDTMLLLKELGVLDKIELVKINNNKRLILPNNDVRVATSSEKNISYLSAKYPKEIDGIKKYFAEIDSVIGELESLKNNSARPNLPVQYPKLWSIKDKSLADFVGGFVKDSGLKGSLTTGWQSFGLPPSRLAAFLFIVASASKKNGYYYIKRRSQRLSDALAETIEEYGGNIIYKTPAKKILVKSNAVSGIATADGKQLPAKIIVSNASAITTLKNMLPAKALPPEYIKKISNYQPSISTFVIWLGLNRDITETIKDSRIAFSSGRGSEADFISCLEGDVDKMSPNIIIYDNYYKGYSKPGTSTVTITAMCGYKPWQRFEADYNAGRKEAYNIEKERWARILMQKIEEKAIPGLSSMIEVKEAATPLTNWRYTGNTDGAIYGFEQSVDNSFLSRIRNRIPVKGLYLASAWGNPGGGYTGALKGGERSFKQIMEDWT